MKNFILFLGILIVIFDWPQVHFLEQQEKIGNLINAENQLLEKYERLKIELLLGWIILFSGTCCLGLGFIYPKKGFKIR